MFFSKKRSPLANLDYISDKTGYNKDDIDLSIRKSINNQIEQQVGQDQGEQAQEAIKETNQEVVDEIQNKKKKNPWLTFAADAVNRLGNVGSGMETIQPIKSAPIDIGQSSNTMEARRQAIMNLLNRK
jgi:hypothetical protein